MKRIRPVSLIMLAVLVLATFICIFDMFGNTFNEDKKTVVFNSGGIKIKGYYVQGDKQMEKGIILLHDEGYDKNSVTAMASAFNKEGYSVFYYDMPGHGSSEGVFDVIYYTNEYLEDTLKRGIDKFIVVSGLEKEDISIFGNGLGARVALKYSAASDYNKDIFLINTFTARKDENLINDNLAGVGKRDRVYLLYSKVDKEFSEYLAPNIYQGLTNEKLDLEKSKNISLNGNVEFNRMDNIIPGTENASNSFIKKIIFKASVNQGFDLASDYFNIRSMMYFLVMIALIGQIFLLTKAFGPNLRVSKKEKSPYAFGIKRLLLTIVVIGIYIAYRYFLSEMIVIKIFPFYEEVLVVFVAYAITGVFGLKYRKVIHTGDTSFGGASALTVGLLICAGIVLWSLMGFTGYIVFKGRLVYLIASVICAWLAFYFYSLESSVMYMKGASARGQKYLIRLIFLIPFLTIFIMSILNEANDLYRMGLQFLLLWLCIYFAEGLQRLGNNLLVSAFFPAVVYGFITVAFTVIL
jgi:esterase/lipase